MSTFFSKRNWNVTKYYQGTKLPYPTKERVRGSANGSKYDPKRDQKQPRTAKNHKIGIQFLPSV
jgi:hypothetical protein